MRLSVPLSLRSKRALRMLSLSILALSIVSCGGSGGGGTEPVLREVILFVGSGVGNEATLAVANPDGTNFKFLDMTGVRPSAHPDGTRIAFNKGDNIATVKPDGSDLQYLTNTNSDIDAKYSPDGTKIVFTSQRDGNEEIYVMNADGSAETRLTNDSSADYSPCWSPDGQYIAFSSGRDANAKIWRIDANGANPIKLTDTASGDDFPIWSPNGNKIAFRRSIDIWTMNADGSNPSILPNLAGANDERPSSWSPDSTKIAYIRSLPSGYNRIFIVNSDGSNDAALIPGPDVQEEHPVFATLLLKP